MDASNTSLTLLGRLVRDPEDAAAWKDFVDRYRPMIYAWCRKGGLQESDADDVTQTALVKVFRQLPDFRYDPARSFRGWLFTITHHALSDLFRERGRCGPGSGDSDVWQRLQSVEAREDLFARLGEAFDLELLEVAKANVRRLVGETKWSAFVLTKVEGRKAREAAEQLGSTPDAVYQAAFRVYHRLREELRRLERPGPGEEDRP